MRSAWEGSTVEGQGHAEVPAEGPEEGASPAPRLLLRHRADLLEVVGVQSEASVGESVGECCLQGAVLERALDDAQVA